MTAPAIVSRTTAADSRSVPVSPRVTELDGLRGLAIALVLWHHLVEPALPPLHSHWLGYLRSAGNLSWCGVDLFFVLSGFFIGGILLDQRDSPRLAGVFYLRRAVRILPLYYATLGLVFLGSSLQVLPSPTFSPWVYGAFGTNIALAWTNHWEFLGYSVLWSLAVEEQFYLAAPWIVRALPGRHLPRLLALLVIAAVALRAGFAAQASLPQLGLHVLTPFRMDTLALGALVAWIVRSRHASAVKAWLQCHHQLLLAATVALLTTLALGRPELGGALLAQAGYTTIALVFALLVLVVTTVRPTGLVRLLQARPLVHLGQRSYCIYLWHGLIGPVIIAAIAGPAASVVTPSGVAAIAIAIAVTLGAASLSWRWFEAPLIHWGRNFRY